MPTNYAERDRDGIVTFYVPLTIRPGISLQTMDDYWRNVHGPVCARLPGQHQYWQLHVGHNMGGIWPVIEGVKTTSSPEENFDGIAELTFKSDADRTTWFKAAGILMDDEHNIFSKAIGYNTSAGNSITYYDAIENGKPNGELGIKKYHIMVRQKDGVSVDDFRRYMKDTFAPNVAKSDQILKMRMHLFEEVDLSRPDAPGVAHSEDPALVFNAAVEIGFVNGVALENFLASDAYKNAIAGIENYVKSFQPYPERSVYTFVYNSEMTLAGRRTSTVAELIENVGAINQLRENIETLMLEKKLI